MVQNIAVITQNQRAGKMPGAQGCRMAALSFWRGNMIKRVVLAVLAVLVAVSLTSCASAQLPVCPEIKLTFCPI